MAEIARSADDPEDAAPMHVRHVWMLLVLTSAWAPPIWAQEPASDEKPAKAKTDSKKALDHDAYDVWNTLTGSTLSDNGEWVAYSLRPGKERADATLKFQATATETGYEVLRGTSARFAHTGHHALYVVTPDQDALKKAEKEKIPPEKRPKNRLEILDLSTGKAHVVDRVQNFKLPEKSGNWVAYRLEKPVDAPEASVKPANGQGEAEKKKKEGEKKEEKQEGEAEKEKEKGENGGPSKRKKEPGTELVLRDLDSGAEVRLPHVVEYEFTENGQRLAFTTSTGTPEEDGVYVVEVGQVVPRAVIQGEGDYRSLVFDESGNHLAFRSTRDDVDAEQPAWTVFHWRPEMFEAHPVAFAQSEGLPEGWWISENGSIRFSEDGSRLLIATAPRPDPKKKEEKKEGEEEEPKAVLDIWHWKDPQLQPQQVLGADGERRRSFLAWVPTDGGPVVQLADEDLRQVNIGDEGNASVALGIADEPYQISDSWESPGFVDLYLVDVATGKRDRIVEKHRGFASLSPNAKYAYWWDYDQKAWIAYDVADRKTINLTSKIPHPLFDEDHDTPSPSGPYGSEGWTKDDEKFLINDRHDVWAVDPKAPEAPVCLTDEVGRERNLRLQVVRLDTEEPWIDPTQPLLLSAFHYKTKQNGFFRDGFGSDKPAELILADESFGFAPRKAKNADVLMLTRSTFEKYPDLWTCGLDFQDMKRLSHANPQQSDYRWGTAELVEWKAQDGQDLQGLLLKPEGFDPSKKYPMLVYFYERYSDTLHNHVTPRPSASGPNLIFYVSRGYVVFVPDITYEVGSPGQSAMNAIVPGVEHVLSLGFVDPERVGVSGHSWGGYQVAYLVTQTNLFACAESGAPVSNMTSAYGGIRWGTGLSRMFQYENTQSRIGAPLWEAREKYLENSPLFYAPQVETPLLILHNDRDGAVPWYQGIEMFVALRRLGKPCWMLNYNGEDHGLTKDVNRRDWSVRMQQFFDHYLKDAPAPQWLSEGVPATEKGENLGLEPAECGEKQEKTGNESSNPS